MRSEVSEEILYEMTREFQVFYLTFCTFALVNCIAVKPYNILLTDLDSLHIFRSVLKNIGPIFP